MEMVHSFCHDDGVDGLNDGRGGGAVGHFVNYVALLSIALLIGGIDKVLSN